jgi:hypothetical protein
MKFFLKALAVVGALASAQAASAVQITPLTLDGGWKMFGFAGVGTKIYNTFGFTVAAGQAAHLTVTDGYTAGDMFEVFSNNVSLQHTYVPTPGGPSLGKNFDLAAANPNFSHRTFYFTAGTYTITMLVTRRAGNSTHNDSGALRLDTAPIPVPAAGFMLLTALGGGAAARRRKA